MNLLLQTLMMSVVAVMKTLMTIFRCLTYKYILQADSSSGLEKPLKPFYSFVHCYVLCKVLAFIDDFKYFLKILDRFNGLS